MEEDMKDLRQELIVFLDWCLGEETDELYFNNAEGYVDEYLKSKNPNTHTESPTHL